jgi:hypothetical protein
MYYYAENMFMDYIVKPIDRNRKKSKYYRAQNYPSLGTALGLVSNERKNE